MSTREDRNERQRSVNFCQLIYDRQIDSPIGFEIRKLLEESVLIDFHDQTRNNKTAIHLAVEKRDVICVKFLLEFRPNLEVRDEDGKTPAELAELHGYQTILNILLNSTFDVVNEYYVEVIDYESLKWQTLEAIKSRSTFKVLKLTNCPSIKDAWKKLGDQDYTKTLNESSHFFFIAIETKEKSIDNDSKLMKKVLNLRRPMIVQLTSSNSQNSKIYFKDDKKDFVEITDAPQMTWEEFNDSVESDDELNLNSLVAALRSNLFGLFTGDLLDTKLNTNDVRSKVVNQFAKSNALCNRFFKLFDESPPRIERIVATLSFNGDQSLLALLDFPFELNAEKLTLTEYQQDISNVVDSSDSNLLMIAAEKNNLDAVKLLLLCGCDFNHSDSGDNRASDICWEMKAFDSLAELIEAGSPYPYSFCIDEVDAQSDAFKRINKMTEGINSFHENIKKGEAEEVKKFIANYPHIKHAFDTHNKCALTVALESKEVDIHSLLLSKGFEPGADDEYRDACSKSKFKDEIRDSHRKYFKEAFDEPHLKRLSKMFRLSFGSKDRANCSTTIRKMFEELNQIDEVIPILEICSLSDKLRIVFDFNCDSVVDMDPTSPSNALGAVYPNGGFVYIGAKNHETEFYKVIGALIHELTHYAMRLTFENSCKPYFDDDTESENQFDTIAAETKKICDENPSTDSVVATVFSLYKKEVWHAELIVRVPQLLAHYKMNPKVLETAQRNTPELFHFYREKTLKDVETQSKVLLRKYLISKINNQTGIARKIENLKVHFENVEIDLKPSVNVITSNAPQLTLAMLSQVCPPNFYIFVSLEQVAIGNILEKIAKVNAKGSSTALIVDCIGMALKYQESVLKLMTSMKNIETIALVMTEVESTKMKNFPKLEFKTCNYKWTELTESSKVHLLDQNVIFQRKEMKLNELVEPTSEAMNFFPLSELLDCKDFRVGNELHQTSHKFYFPRKFIRKGLENLPRVKANAKSFEELSRNEPRMGVMMISDDAGSGKSVALFEIATSLHVAFPDRWIQFVDLKRHIGAFKSVEDCEKIESFAVFIVQNILKNEPDFDRELFMQMFRTGKTFILFDGFDEISPNYKALLLHALNLFESGSGNQLFIATRPHLEADLEDALGKFVFKLEKLSEECQTSFLREHWRSVGFEISHEGFEVLSKRLLEQFSKIATSNIIGLPLLLRMTAEIFEDLIKENLLHKVESLSISAVFRKFVEKYFLRWTSNENEISRKESVKFVMNGGVLEVHHNIALKHIFGGEFMSFEVSESDAERISRVGLIRYDKTEKTFQFIHETFAEYFVADFICFHLIWKNRDPSHDCSKAVEILIEVLMRNTKVIQTFLDQALQTMKFIPSEAFCKSVAKCLRDNVESKNRFDFLARSLIITPEDHKIMRTCLDESAEYLTSFLLSIVKHVEKDVLLEMIQPNGTNKETVFLMVAAYGSKATVSTFCDIITKCTDNAREIFQYHRNNYFNNNILMQAAGRNRNFGVLTTLCASFDSVLTEGEIKIMLKQEAMWEIESIIIITLRNSTDEVFLELLSLLPKYFSLDEIKCLLLAVDYRNRNFFHRAVLNTTSKRLKLTFDVVKANFDVEQQKASFYQPARHPNMFLFAAQNRNIGIFGTIIESTRDVLSGDEIKAMLVEKDSAGSNMLHIITATGNEDVLNELNLLLRERLSNDEIESLLLEVNKNRKNCFRLAANNTKLSLQVFCETIGNLLPVDDRTRLLQQSSHEIDIIHLACGNHKTNEILPVWTIKQLLTREKNYGRNAFHEVAHYKDADTWNKMISFTQARFSNDQMKSFLLCCDGYGQNCLHLAVSRIIHGKMIEAICKTIKTVGLSVEDQKKFVMQNVYADRNVFHLASTSRTFNCFSLHDGLSTILSKDEIKEMLKAKDSSGDNILCFNRKYPTYEGASCDFIAFLQEVLSNDEIKDLLFDVDCEGRNFFHCAVEFSPKFEIKSSSEAIKKILSRDDQKKFFAIPSPNIFHLALRNSLIGIFSTLHECLKDVLTEDEIKSLFQEKNSENKNVLHLLCQYEANYDNKKYDKDKKLRDFLKVLKEVCNVAELKTFLTCSNDDGGNCLLLAAQFQDQLFSKELLNFIRSELSIDEQRSLTRKCDNDRHNIFKCASLNEIPGMLTLVEQFAGEIFSKNQIRELKKRRN